MARDVIAGRYRLLEPLGRGAMSTVWLAEDAELGRRVAVKILGPDAARERFEREARAAAALSHPHICRLYDYGTAGGNAYMVLEHLAGGTLEDRLRAAEPHPLPDDETLRVAAEVAAGLAHAHDRGLVHRDLKPANVLFDAEGRAKIADFGIARLGAGGTLTEAGTVLGTASYLSPEQAAGVPAGPASDVYSFGVMLFRMLTGRLPFAGTHAMEVVRMHRDEPPPRVADLRPDAPARLERLVDTALAKESSARPQDGAALLAALRGRDAGTTATMVLAPAATAATRVVASPPASDRGRRSTIPLALGALLLLAGAGAGLALLATRGSDDAPAQPAIPLTPPPAVPTSSPAETPAETEPEPTEPATTEPETTVEATTARPESTQATTTRPTTTTAAATTTAPPPATTAPAAPTIAVPTTTETFPSTTTTATVEPSVTTIGGDG